MAEVSKENSKLEELQIPKDQIGKKDDLKSPINGSTLEPKDNGLFYSEADGLYYTVNEGKINSIDLKSPINGSTLEQKEDGLLYSEADGLYYTVNEGTIMPMQSPINGSPLKPKGDGSFYSEYDDMTYTIDKKGEITAIEGKTIYNDLGESNPIENIEEATAVIRSSEINEEVDAVRRAIEEPQKRKDSIQNEKD